jgi:two-component system, NarL family, sensor kinase
MRLNMQDPDKRIIINFLIIATLLILLLLGLIMTILFLYQKRQHGFAIELEKVRTGFEKELLTTQLEIQEQTFQYISQEIHDNIGQFISLAKLHLNTLNLEDIERSGQQISNSTDLLTRALDDLRDLSKSLSSEVIKNGGLTKAIELQISQLKKLEKLKVICRINGDYRFLDEQKEMFILRILQEAINNVIRHSEADTIEILLSYMDRNLSLLIRDNGKGFNIANVQKGKTSGISNMTKRAKMIGAKFNIDSSARTGTLIVITVPY